MRPGTDDERGQNAEPTFADIMNGFSFDAGRAPRRRRWGRRRGEDVELRDTEGVAMTEGTPQGPPGEELYTHSAPQPLPNGPTGPIDLRVVEPEPVSQPSTASAVRPYAWTRGRTKSGLDLAIEALVSTSQRGRDQMGLLQVEHRAVAELCEQTRSVAEVAALLSLPLGVARVLLGDMAGLGVVTVHQTASSSGTMPDLALMERVLSGLRRL